MNGIIDGSSLFSNTGIYSRQTKVYSEDKKTTAKADTKSKSFQSELDSVDISGASREIPQAGYSKPAMQITSKAEEAPTYKPISSEGIQEGIKLSDKAKDLLKELQEKYGDQMDIYVANWSSDEEQDYYSGLSDKRFNALINPELLEQMANDETIREKYESVLSSAGETSDKIAEELGEDIASNIKSFSVTIDADGNVSYIVSLLKDFTEKNAKSTDEIEKQRQEQLEEKKAEEKAAKKKEEKEKQYEKITASSIEELIEKIKADFTSEADDIEE